MRVVIKQGAIVTRDGIPTRNVSHRVVCADVVVEGCVWWTRKGVKSSARLEDVTPVRELGLIKNAPACSSVTKGTDHG